MTTKSFNLGLALAGHPVETKDGRKVTNIKVVNSCAPFSAESVDEYDGEEYKQGLLATIHNINGASEYPYYHGGGSHLYGVKTDADLVMV